MDWVTLLARVFLAVSFLLGSLGKLADRKEWQRALTDYHVPERLVVPMAFLLPLLELATVALLVPNNSARWGAIAALGLLGLFTAVAGFNSRAAGRTTLLRNGLLATAAGVVLWRGGATPDIASTVARVGVTPAAWIALAIALSALALALIEAWFILNLLSQQGRILAELEKVQRAVGVVPDVIYHPTNREAVEAMLRVANVTAADTVYDLGCGDGRIAIAAAERGARAVGIDIDPVRISMARANAEAESKALMDRVHFVIQNLFEADIRPATVATLYLGKEINERLRPKLLRELRPGTRVVSYDFPMGDWQPDKQVEEHRVYLWVIPADLRGTWTWHLPDNMRVTARLQQTYQQVSGRVAAGRQTIPLLSIHLVGDSITLVVRHGVEELTYRGQVSGDSISGTVQDGSGTNLPWSARRISRGMAGRVRLQRARQGEQRYAQESTRETQ
jgi:SAM-dependent methyltransferase